MAKEVNLTEGSISKALVRLALPIMGTAFIQMAYNMTDMIWIGRLGSKSVAAVGTAGFFTWLANAFILIPRMGAEIGVAQSVGRGDWEEARRYARHTLQMIIALALVYSAALILLKNPLIDFFKLQDPVVIKESKEYLVIVSLGLIFTFVNPVLTAILNGQGDSSTPFKINVVGLLINIVLDPVLIFGWGFFPALGVQGAAIATVFAQVVVTALFIYFLKKRGKIFQGLRLQTKPDAALMKSIIRLGFPVALQSGLFTIIAMFVARIIAQWGPTPVAVQKVGSQIESISWMTAGGFSTAIGTFVGQNFGAKKWDRIVRGYFIALGIVGAIGIFATLLLILGAGPIFAFFIPDPEAIGYGIPYLRILGVSQLFMCIEIATQGAFNGLGKTVPPSVVGIGFNFLRIPMAMVLSSTFLGLEGVWWSISISSVFKGLVLTGWFLKVLYKDNALKAEVGDISTEEM